MQNHASTKEENPALDGGASDVDNNSGVMSVAYNGPEEAASGGVMSVAYDRRPDDRRAGVADDGGVMSCWY